MSLNYLLRFILIDMAIVFKQQIRKQRNLILILAAVAVVGGFVFWWNSKIQPGLPDDQQLTAVRFRKIEINFDVLDSTLLSGLKPMDKIPQFEGNIGKENPFVE